MGQDCSSCKICGDQEEIRAESSISSNNIIILDFKTFIILINN